MSRYEYDGTATVQLQPPLIKGGMEVAKLSHTINQRHFWTTEQRHEYFLGSNWRINNNLTHISVHFQGLLAEIGDK